MIPSLSPSLARASWGFSSASTHLCAQPTEHILFALELSPVTTPGPQPYVTTRMRQHSDGLSPALCSGAGSVHSAAFGWSRGCDVPSPTVISSGSAALDEVLEIGGFPRGRLVEIVGDYASGKTTLALSTAAACQRQGGTVLWLDADYSFDALFAARRGVALEHLLLVQPKTLEDVSEILETLLTTGAIDMVVFDSPASLPCRYEHESPLAAEGVDVSRGRVLQRFMPKLRPLLSKTKTCIVVINQLRSHTRAPVEPCEETTLVATSGRAFAPHASVRLFTQTTRPLTARPPRQPRTTIAPHFEVRIMKNNLGPDGRTLVLSASEESDRLARNRKNLLHLKSGFGVHEGLESS